MRIENLRYIVEVSKYKSINKASKNLYINQQQLSRIISQTEECFNITIFERTAKGSVLTDKGKETIRKFEEILDIYDSIIPQKHTSLAQNLHGKIKILSDINIWSAYVDVYKEFIKKYSSISVHTECMPSEKIVKFLQENEGIGQISRIIYEDKDIIVVNKPKGMVVHPGNGNPDGTLVNAIMAICKDSLSGIGGEIRPGIVHRLDKDTSGIIIVAKNDKAHINLSEQIKDHKVKKTYIALVKGIVKENTATINMPIGRSEKDRIKMAVTKKGKEAITHFKVLKRYPEENCTLLEVNIETGRTHQIRVHLAQIGHPCIGDEVYSSGKNKWGIKGQALHAKSLEFKHPITGEKMKLEAPIIGNLGTGLKFPNMD